MQRPLMRESRSGSFVEDAIGLGGEPDWSTKREGVGLVFAWALPVDVVRRPSNSPNLGLNNKTRLV